MRVLAGKPWRGAVCLLVASSAALSGCSVFERVPEPDETAEAVASAFAAGSVEEAFGSATAQEEYAAIVAGLGEDVTPEVTLMEVETTDEEETEAVATLRWTWPLGIASGGEGWSYETEVALTRAEDEWQPVWDPAVVETSLVEGETFESGTISATRGRVLGAGGRVIVGPRPVVRFGIDRSLVQPPEAVRSARALARLLGIEVEAYADRVRSAGDRAFVEGIAFRQEEVPARVSAGYERIRGALAVPDDLPLAPTREFAAPILGTVGEVTAEILEAEPEAYGVGDLAGLSGLQARYEEQLRGTPGLLVLAEPGEDAPAGLERRELFRVEPQDGDDLRLTLSPRLQSAAESVLTGVPSASALVAIRPSDGAILAAANGAGTDGLNAATYGQFAPGSTFKIVSALALLRAGLTRDSSVECPSTLVVDGRPFGNYDDYPSAFVGTIPLHTALANSCNTAFINGRTELAEGDLAAAAASLGLGVDHDVGFPSYFGQVPPPASETESAADMIGQGKVLASPMAMATVMASVVNGRTVVPFLVEDVTSPVPDVVSLRPGEVRDLRSMLAEVVSAGSANLLADLPGPTVLAKTGTAEWGTEAPLRKHAWMVAGQGDLAVAVFVQDGQSGSRTAGPLVEAFLRAAG